MAQAQPASLKVARPTIFIGNDMDEKLIDGAVGGNHARSHFVYFFGVPREKLQSSSWAYIRELVSQAFRCSEQILIAVT